MKKWMLVVFLGGLAAGLAAAQETDFTLLQKYKTAESRLEKAQGFLAAGNDARCEKELNSVLDIVRDHHEAHHLMSILAYKKGDLAGALAHIEAAKAGYIHVNDVYLKFLAERAKREQDALSPESDASELHLMRGSNKCQIGEYLITTKSSDDRQDKKGEIEGSGESLQPVPAEYEFFHGNCLFKLERFAEAEARYRAALAGDPKHAGAATNLAGLLLSRGRPQEARDVLLKAQASGIAVNPKLKAAVDGACGK